MPRKQLNIGLSLEAYEQVRGAAEAEGVTVTEFCRGAILAAAAEPEVAYEDHGFGGVPAWLLAFLVFVTRRGSRVE